MAKAKPPHIDDIIRNKWFVEFNRKPIDKFPLYGFILGYSDKLTLIQVFDLNSFALNGYSVLRNKDIKSFRVYDRDEYFLSKFIALKQLDVTPLPVNSLDDWKDALILFGDRFPLLTIHQEIVNRGACYIGKLAELGKTKVVLDEIDSNAKASGTFKYKYADITKIDAGGNYENALNFVFEAENKSDHG